MRLFRKPKDIAPCAQNTDTAVIREKLVSAEAEIAEASAELDRLALRAVLAGDQSASGASACLDALRQRRDLLTRALVAAVENERTSREALNARENQARKRALSQHAGRLQRDAADVSTALRQLHDALNGMTASGAAITALLPASMLTGQPWDKFFGAEELRKMTLLEAYRQGRGTGTLLFDRPPAARALERSEDGSLPALSDRIASLTASVRARFDQSAPVVPASQPTPEHAAKPLTPLPVLSAAPASSLPVASGDDPALSSSPAAGAEAQPWPAVKTSGEVIDLRGRDLGVPKQPTDQPPEPAELHYFTEE